MPNLNNAGKWLSHFRFANGKMSQETLAEKVHLSPSTVRAIEQGRRPLTSSTVEAIAKAIGSDLLTGDIESLRALVLQDKFAADQKAYSEVNDVHDWLHSQLMAIDATWKSQMDESREAQLRSKSSCQAWETVERALLQATHLMMDHRLEDKITNYDCSEDESSEESAKIIGEYLVKWALRIIRLSQTSFGRWRDTGTEDSWGNPNGEDLCELCRTQWIQLSELSRTWFLDDTLPYGWARVDDIEDRFRHENDPHKPRSVRKSRLPEKVETPLTMDDIPF